MKITIVILTLIVFFFEYTNAVQCQDGSNPCSLDTIFSPQKGYRCLDISAANVACICPNGGFEINTPCRVCNRVNPADNACNRNNTNLIMCLEDSITYGTPFVCLCSDTSGNPFLTTSAECSPTGIIATTTAPSPVTAPIGTLCSNGGVFYLGACNCPSGYFGSFCEQKFDRQLCDRIVCKNNAVCAVRNPTGPFEAVCLCRYATWGEYCELNGTLGFCSASSCTNGGACKENVVGTTRHAYCVCPAGYNGPRCENRYFTCSGNGKFADTDLSAQGKYIECTAVNGVLRAQQRSCPKGLRFNAIPQLCTL